MKFIFSAAIEAKFDGTCALTGKPIKVGDRIRRLNGPEYCHSRYSNLDNVRAWGQAQAKKAIEIVTPVAIPAIELGIRPADYLEKFAARRNAEIESTIKALETGFTMPSRAGANVREMVAQAEETVRDLTKTIARKQREAA